MAGSVTVRPLAPADLDAIMSIEEQSFVQPWSRGLFSQELAQPSRGYLVAEHDGDLVGYGGIMVVGDDAHLLTVAVDPHLRRGGIASRLMAALVALARRRGARHVTLEVRESNQAARALYDKFGFQPAGRRKGYYATEDAVVMWAVDIDSIEYQHTLGNVGKEAS